MSKPLNFENILDEYDRQFIEMQNEFINILTSIKEKNNVFEIKNICQKNIDIIKKDQEIESSNIYNMQGKII